MPSAAADLESISDYLAASLPAYRDQTLHQIYESIRGLRRFSHRGRLGKRPGTREIVFPQLPYVATYRVKNGCVEVLRILHGAQNK